MSSCLLVMSSCLLVLPSCQFVVLSCRLVMSSCLLVVSSQLLVLSSSRFFVFSCLLVLSSCQFVMSSCLLGSISCRCSGKWAHTYPPKKWLDACDFLCWFKPLMLPPADFRLAKIVVEIITSKQKVLPWFIAWWSDFDGAETLGEILEFWRNTTFCSIVCCELFFWWLWLEKFCIFKDLFKAP